MGWINSKQVEEDPKEMGALLLGVEPIRIIGVGFGEFIDIQNEFPETFGRLFVIVLTLVKCLPLFRT